MTILKRVSRKVVVPGEPPVPAELPWVEYVADDTTLAGIPASRVKTVFPWARTTGSSTDVPTTGTSTNVPVENGGGSLSDRGGYYTTTSYGGVPGTYVVTVKPDGSRLVVRV